MIFIIGLIIGALISYFIMLYRINEIIDKWLEEKIWEYEKNNYFNNSDNSIYNNKE